jgi:hypothetical protein
MKQFILNADDFGLSIEFNNAVLEGYKIGLLKSVSLCANGNAFTDAIDNIIPKCPNLGIGCHLNIMEGKALTHCDLLTDDNGVFNNNYLYLILNSYRKEFLKQIENEFRAQIEKIIKYIKIDHLDSHVHTHAIPKIFELTCKLAKEYNIDYVRTQCEKIYFVPKIKKILTIKYPINIIKVIILNFFTLYNRHLLKKYKITTNDFILGINYTGMMDSSTIEYGLKNLKREGILVETLIHPCLYNNNSIHNQHYIEFLITVDKTLKQKINKMGFNLVNYKKY